MRRHLRLSLALLVLSLAPASATTISGSVNYSSESIGAFGSWSIGFTASHPGVLLQVVTIDLGPTGLFFDTAAGAPGFLLWQDFQPTGGTDIATGFSGVNLPLGLVPDGSTLLALAFNAFTPAAGPFTFLLDVDGPANYAGCPTGFLGALCRAGRNLDASLVTSDEIQGALVTMDFWVPEHGNFQVDTTLGVSGDFTADGGFEATATPEPGTWALLGAGLAALVLRRRLAASANPE
ncbi:MAG: PEP-CTERM sorting domain-containing protein [Bryobacterales bacterium]|nr:PEP-CTERM sorting domain-containing protein [Bryobacterales bacterium]